MKASINEIKNSIDNRLNYLRETYNIKELGVFGSVVRGQNVESSDIDLLVEFSEPIGLFKFIELENYLSKLLGKKVDLVTKKALKSAIREDVLREVVYV